MKSISLFTFFVVLLLSSSLKLKAQPISLLKTENLWSVLNRGDADGADPVYNGTSLVSQWLKIGNDTIIEGKKYKIIRSSNDESHSMWEKGLDLDKKELFLREESGKVYQYHDKDIEESFLYDFNFRNSVDTHPVIPGIPTHSMIIFS